MAMGEGKRRAPLSLLVVEDEPRVAWVIRAILERSGHEVAVASSIAEAGGLLAAVEPDAAIVDFILPDGDGLTFARRARAGSGVAIIVMSGLADVPDADGVITLLKPFTPDQLEQALALALAQSRTAR
jgi:DNA-binding response OmpR family regulator